MKKSNINIIIYVTLGVIAVLAIDYFFLRQPAGKNEASPAQEESASPVKEQIGAAVKEVVLNDAQFKTAGIELGTFFLKNLSEVVTASGYTELPPQNQADVSVHGAGIVTRINVIEGQRVKRGQVLAVVESPEFARLQEQYITSKSNLEFLAKEFERQKILSDENVNSKKVFQRTKADYETEKARFASLGRQLSLMNLGTAAATGTMAVTAPISGSVTNINIKIGSNAEVGKPLLSIIDNTMLHVDLSVFEKDLSKVKPGQNVRFVLTNQDKKELKGKIFNVSQSFQNESKSVAVHADMLNPGAALIPGMYVNALIDVGAHPVSALPSDAIVRAEGREYIFVLEEEGHHEAGHDEHDEELDDDGHTQKGPVYHFERIEVKTGTSQLGFTQVTPLHEMPENAKVAIRGAYYIQSHLVKTSGGGGHEH